jgi:glc operon protein GlcG
MPLRTFLIALLALTMARPAAAQTADAKVLTLAGARTMMEAAEAEARRNNWNVAIAIVDAHGELILFQKMDNVQVASVDISQAKARTAARMRRPTKALDDAVTGGRLALLAVDGVLPLEGGVPVIHNGVVIGAVGVSGVMSAQDAQIAAAGIRAVFP